ncbi:MAG: 4-(cytidine 5'-diphospho)-2-C-methyl-D-erythritol kinase [Cyanobacteria bacterium P01_A01_bin.84]
MRSYILTAPAKINLYLEIIGNRPDNFHELVMIMQSIDLADIIEIQASSLDKIRIRTNNSQLPTDESNLAYKAAKVMQQQFPQAFAQYGGVDITIDKRIPIAAGLAGGSTDAAAVLVGIDMMWELGLTRSELEEIAATLGSDIPFCIGGGTAIATGRGEKLSSLTGLNNQYIVLGKHRSLEVSTPWAYKTYREKFSDAYITDDNSFVEYAEAVHSSAMVKAIIHQNISEIAQELHNDLEKIVLPAYPKVLQLREKFQKAGVLGTMMSGSGPSVFALCKSQQQAEEIKLQIQEAIPDEDLELFVAQLINQGIQVSSEK